MTTQISYPLLVEQFRRAASGAKAQGHMGTARLWIDGLDHLEALREQRDELLEALVRLMKHAPAYPDESGYEDGLYQAAKDRALAAIAKASS